MKIIAHMHADLYDMEDGAEEIRCRNIDCAGTGNQYIELLAGLIINAAESIGIPVDRFMSIIEAAIPLMEEAQTIDNLKGEG